MGRKALLVNWTKVVVLGGPLRPSWRSTASLTVLPPREGLRSSLVDDNTGAPVGTFCQGCALVTLHEGNDRAAQQARESRWTKPDRRGV